MATKENRLNLRLRAGDDDLIRRAADTVGQTVSEFLTAAALDVRTTFWPISATSPSPARRGTGLSPRSTRQVRIDPRLVELFARPRRITLHQ